MYHLKRLNQTRGLVGAFVQEQVELEDLEELTPDDIAQLVPLVERERERAPYHVLYLLMKINRRTRPLHLQPVESTRN